VPAEDDKCPNCKLKFIGVRCPQCHHQDSVSAFLKGCPQCGYKLNPPSPQPHKAPQKTRERIPPPIRNTSLDLFTFVVVLLLTTFTMLLYFSGSF
jgi:Zn ribbon nucleic-acid-binding protein